MAHLRTELIALLDACKDEPDEDAPRFVLADWLEEYGDEADRARAEFVRLQLGGGDERSLLREHGPAWLWPIMDAMDVPITSGGVRHDRGLLHVEISVDDLADAHAKGELARREQWAWVQALTLTYPDPGPMLVLRGSPLLEGVTELRLEGRCNSACFDRLLDQPLRRLQVLDLSDAEVAYDALGPVAGWAPMLNLRVLRVRGPAATDYGVRKMLDLQQPGGLRELTAINSRITADGAAALGAARAFPHLRRLDLSGCPALGPEGVRGLLAGALDSLTHLRLDGTGPGDDGVKALAECPHLTALRCLYLAENQFTSVGALSLAKSPHLRRLERLDLAFNDVSGHGGFALLDSPTLAGLQSLDLTSNSLGPRWAGAVATRLRGRLALRSLRLGDNALGPGAAALVGCEALSGLRQLDLSENGMSDEGCEALARATRPGLTHLDLSDNDVTDRGALALAASPALAGLRELRLTGNPVSDETLRKLVRRFGAGCAVRGLRWYLASEEA